MRQFCKIANGSPSSLANRHLGSAAEWRTRTPSGVAFKRPRDCGAENGKGFDPPNASPAQPRVSLDAMYPNTPARPRRLSTEQRLVESTRKRVSYHEQSRVKEVVEERQREEKVRAQQQICAQEARNSRRQQQRAERPVALSAYELDQEKRQHRHQASRAAGDHIPPQARVGCVQNTFGAAVSLTLRQFDVL